MATSWAALESDRRVQTLPDGRSDAPRLRRIAHDMHLETASLKLIEELAVRAYPHGQHDGLDGDSDLLSAACRTVAAPSSAA